MAFSLDRTRSFVRIDEPNLLSIRRSTSPIVPDVDYSQGHLFDAFICAVREYNLFRVYIGLYDTQLKSNLVFVADPVGFDNKKTAILLKEAESFLTNIGFCMEQVNMEFSPATREVIMRDMKVMREPPLAVRLDAAMFAIEALTLEKKELLQKASRAHKTYKTEVDKLRQQVLSANTAKIEPAEKPVLHEESVADLILERDTLKAELDNIREKIEVDKSEQLHANVKSKKAQHDQHSFDTLLKAAKEESRVLLKERDIAKQEAYDASQEILVLNDLVQAAQEDVRASKVEVACLLEQISKTQDEASAAQTEVQAARQETQVLQNAVKVLEEQAQADKIATQALYSEETGSLQQEIDRLQREHDAIIATQSNEINALRAALTIADENLSFERTKNESALQEMDALERNAAAELKKLKKMVDSLSDDKRTLESMAAELKVKANGEIERLQQINQSQRRVAIKKVKALKEEMRQLSEARAVIASPIGVSLSTVDSKTTSDSGYEMETEPLFAGSASFNVSLSNPFGVFDKFEYVNFEPDSTLEGIPYAILEDVVEVHRSFNKIQAAPLGNQVQSCDGFVCLVKDLSQSMMVYVVWYMKETGEVLVCRPDHIPEGGDIVLNMVREGIAYFERVGFIMDELILMPDPEQRQHQIDSLPFFHKINMECAA